MKKIALIMDGWKRFFTYAWPAGILQRIKETGEDVNLYIFNSSGDWSLDDDYNIGEYNIYSLPNLSDFDGIILDTNNIRYPDVSKRIIEAAKKTGKPVISIAKEIEDFYYVGIDNYASIQKMIAHLHEKHGCGRFWFIMGPPNNYENQVRVAGLKDYMRSHGIAYQEQDFYYESYAYQCGVHGFEYLYKLSDGYMPEAIICASDNIAVGVCEAAANHGLRVPQDFYVTGFDNFDKAAYYVPKITTIGHIREEVGYRCADILLRIWNGEHVDKFNYTSTECIFWDSCGCKSDTEVDHATHAKGQIIYDIETTEFEEQVLTLEYELMNCKTVKEMSRWIPECIPAMKCDAMYLVLDDHINDFKKKKELYDFHIIQDEEFHIHGYPEKMNVEFAYVDGKIMAYNNQISGLFPMFDYDKGGTDMLFMPIHFRSRTVGFFVIRNAVYLMEKQYLFRVLNVLISAMENLHEKEKLEYMNHALTELSVRDTMTGLYNRLGYQQIACRYFEEKKKKEENLLIMFADMDKLKHINDHYGHEYGDEAIKLIASAILHNIPEPSIPIRMGGDEFLIMNQIIPEEKAEGLIHKIQNEIQAQVEQKNLPFELSFSIGCIRTDWTADRNLDEYVKEADEIMYQEKSRKKLNRME